EHRRGGTASRGGRIRFGDRSGEGGRRGSRGVSGGPRAGARWDPGAGGAGRRCGGASGGRRGRDGGGGRGGGGGGRGGRAGVAAEALGAAGVQLGTAFLASDECGAIPAYKEAVLRATDDGTALTRAFSGRPARGLVNRFLTEMENHPDAILPFPVQNAVTRP